MINIDEVIKEAPAVSFVSASILSSIVFIKGMSFILNSLLTLDERLKRKRRKLVSRSIHSSRSKFKGFSLCSRQRFKRIRG